MNNYILFYSTLSTQTVLFFKNILL